MNPQYIGGRSSEYKVRHLLEKEGYFVVRAAGSKGPVDLIAIYKEFVYLIQVKRGNISSDEWNGLLQLASQHGCCVPIIAECRLRKPVVFWQILSTRQRHGRDKPAVEWTP